MVSQGPSTCQVPGSPVESDHEVDSSAGNLPQNDNKDDSKDDSKTVILAVTLNVWLYVILNEVKQANRRRSSTILQTCDTSAGYLRHLGT